jgi:pyruvate,water dikinase
MTARYVRPFSTLRLEDVPLVGGKSASLGEMHRVLASLGVRVPDGFAVTADAYRAVLSSASIDRALFELLADLRPGDTAGLAERGARCRALIHDAGLPEDVWSEVRAAYDALGAGEACSVAVRSSATAEDLPDASFAGQQESYLNVSGHESLREAVVLCMASLFTDRAISYRMDKGFAHEKVALSVAVQRMVRSDLGSAGVLFTIDTESGFRDVVIVNGAWGLGENVVKGSVIPDEFWVFKPTLGEGRRPLLKRRLGEKQLRMVFATGGAETSTRNEPVSEADRRRFCLTDDEVLTLAEQAVRIERHYSERAGRWMPMDIEWAKDGATGELFIVQARPETVQSQRDREVLETYVLERRSPVLVVGKSVGQGIGAGVARVIDGPERLGEFRDGEVLVAPTTTPDWEPVMKRASAIVTDRGGRTCHAAIVARELGIPAVVGTSDGTRKVESGAAVTVSCSEGDAGYVYQGALPFRVDRVSVRDLRRPRTKMMMNVGDPSQAFGLAAIPNDGVGLARLEFIINNTINVHPMALLHPERVDDQSARETITKLTAGYSDKAEYFVDKLAQGVGCIAAAFYPKPVIVRLSDFKSNEYRSLVGGAPFEPLEENPMIGLRGAARYTHESYRDAFALECRAMKRVREAMGLDNVRLMVPFCRRVAEGERVIAEMARHGLVRGERGLEVYVMCEIPNNVLLIEEFCQVFDGISIGSNDLTQLTLGVDRDSALVAFEFDERDPGVVKFLRAAVEGARRAGRHSGICGQAPSDYPEMAELLVRAGIESISLNPDSVLRTTLSVLALEQTLDAERARAAERDR